MTPTPYAAHLGQTMLARPSTSTKSVAQTGQLGTPASSALGALTSFGILVLPLMMSWIRPC